jgi:hypothetical protein
MKQFKFYLSGYIVSLKPLVFFSCVLFIAAAIFTNYHYHLNEWINEQGTITRVLSWWIVFFVAFAFGYLLLAFIPGKTFQPGKVFFILLFIAPLMFACKMSVPLNLHFSMEPARNTFINAVAYFPLKLIIVLLCLRITWMLTSRDQPFYGTSTKGFNAKPYFLLLLFMIPLIMLAAGQHDFQLMYPKLTHLAYFRNGNGNWWEKFLYEILYGTDFVSIEFFFRGFLILAFVRWAGQDAILPMALFYCTIHFGKPLGECISSFFGGILLGIITYHTRTIYGGLIVHLGIAWMMEIAGTIVNR